MDSQSDSINPDVVGTSNADNKELSHEDHDHDNKSEGDHQKGKA